MRPLLNVLVSEALMWCTFAVGEETTSILTLFSVFCYWCLDLVAIAWVRARLLHAGGGVSLILLDCDHSVAVAALFDDRPCPTAGGKGKHPGLTGLVFDKTVIFLRAAALGLLPGGPRTAIRRKPPLSERATGFPRLRGTISGNQFVITTGGGKPSRGASGSA